MAKERDNRSVTFFSVGNGNSSLISLGSDIHLLFDLNELEDGFSVLGFLKGELPTKNKKLYLDVLCVSHGDQDHIRGVSQLLKDFVIGEIWYPNYDRFEEEGDDQSDDYLALHDEIERRRKAMAKGSEEPGDLAFDLTAMDEVVAIAGDAVEDFVVRILSPYRKDEDEPDFDINDMSLVANITVSGMSWLFAADTSSRIWLERINTHLLAKEGYEDWARANVLVAAHHGSYTFFGRDREGARDNPVNLDALSKSIKPGRILVSSKEKFPLKDSKGDDPPHYAAYKWYKDYLKNNDLCEESDEHPFLYTCEGHVRFEWDDGEWTIKEDWNPKGGGDDGNGGSSKLAYTPVAGVGEHAPRKWA